MYFSQCAQPTLSRSLWSIEHTTTRTEQEPTDGRPAETERASQMDFYSRSIIVNQQIRERQQEAAQANLVRRHRRASSKASVLSRLPFTAKPQRDAVRRCPSEA